MPNRAVRGITYNNDTLLTIARAAQVARKDTIDDHNKLRNLGSHLEVAAMWYRLDCRAPKRAAPSTLIPRLRRICKQSMALLTALSSQKKDIRSTARALLRVLAIRDPVEAPDGPGDPDIADAFISTDSGTEESVTRAIARIGRLVESPSELDGARDAAKHLEVLAVEAEGNVTYLADLTGRQGHAGNLAVNGWVEKMLPIYVSFRGVNVGTSVGAPGRPNEGEAGGPLIRFLHAAAEPLGLSMSADAWRSRIRQIRSGPAS